MRRPSHRGDEPPPRPVDIGRFAKGVARPPDDPSIDLARGAAAADITPLVGSLTGLDVARQGIGDAAVGGLLVAAGPLPVHAGEQATTMQIDRSGTSPGDEPPEATFSGDVRIGDFFLRAASSRSTGATVTFGPGARTPNPTGRWWFVTSGMGWAQVEGAAIAEIRPGDVIWFPPGERHWEGA